MNYRVVDHTENAYIELLGGDGQIESEQHALDLVGICGEHRLRRLMLHAENLTPDFYQLRTGLAGDVLQKFVNYSIKCVAVLTPELVGEGRFYEMVLEANRRNRSFHVFYNRDEAEAWLVSG